MHIWLVVIAERTMRKKPIKYSVGEIGRVRLIKDQLPSWKKLAARGAKRGELKTDWKAAAKKAAAVRARPRRRHGGDRLGDRRTPAAAPQGAHDAATGRRHARLVPRAREGLSNTDQRDPAQVFRAAYEVRGALSSSLPSLIPQVGPSQIANAGYRAASSRRQYRDTCHCGIMLSAIEKSK